MDDSRRVSRGQGRRRLPQDFKRLAKRPRPEPLHALGERAAAAIVHRVIQLPGLAAAEMPQHRDVVMGESGQRPPLTQKPLARALAGRQLTPDHLDGHFVT